MSHSPPRKWLGAAEGRANNGTILTPGAAVPRCEMGDGNDGMVILFKCHYHLDATIHSDGTIIIFMPSKHGRRKRGWGDASPQSKYQRDTSSQNRGFSASFFVTD